KGVHRRAPRSRRRSHRAALERLRARPGGAMRRASLGALGAAISIAVLASAQTKPAPARTAPAQAIAITGGSVFLPGGRAPLQFGTVVVSDGRIRAVAPGLAAPTGARIIDARG